VGVVAVAVQSTEATRDAVPAVTAGRRAEALALLVLFTALFALVGRGTFFSSDEGGSYNTTVALLRGGSLAIAPGENIHRGKDNRFYSCREILPALLCIPSVLTGNAMERHAQLGPPPSAQESRPGAECNWPIFFSVMILGPLAMAGTLLCLHAFVRYEGGSSGDALLLTVTAACATPLLVYAKTIFPQVFESLLLMLAFLAAVHWRQTGSARAALVLGVACGLSSMNRVTAAPVTLCFLAYLFLTGLTERRKRLRAILLFLLPVMAGAAVTGLVNWMRWGSPFDSGRHRDDETFSTPPWIGVTGLLASPGKGLWIYAPVMLLPLVFIRKLWQKGRSEVLLAIAITAIYLGIYGCWYDWQGGLAWGPRFLIALIAPWLALLGRAFPETESGWARLLVAVLLPIGVAIQAVGVALHPKWTRYSEPFSLPHSHLVEQTRILFTLGPDDLWLWSHAGASHSTYTALVLTLTFLVLAAVVWLWRGAGRGERFTLLVPAALTMLLLAGIFL
jgi:hypothetical protein